MVERAGGEDRQRNPLLHSDSRGACHCPVAAGDGEHLGPRRGVEHYLLRIVGRIQFDDLGTRQLFADRGEDVTRGSAAGLGIGHQDHPVAARAGWGGHAQRLGAGQPGRCDRGDQMRTEDRDAGARGEAGQHIAGVVHAGGHPGQPDQAGQQCQSHAQRWAFQADPDGERRRTGRVARRQRG